MARYLGPKCRLCRREGVKLFLKGERCYTKCPLDRKGAIPPGQRDKKRRKRPPSDYAIRLREKQKVKRIYGVLERQFKRYFQRALKHGDKELTLFQLLESRLDNVVRRFGFCLSLSTARQLVKHGHILVNERKVDVPSYQVQEGDIISLTPKAQALPQVEKALKAKFQKEVPSWLERKGLVGKVKRLPEREDLPQDLNGKLIIEFYA